MDQAFMRDAVELATERVARGELDRRTFVRGLALLGLGAAVAPRLAEAQKPKEIVLVNWGGDALKHFYDAWGKPYETDSGIKVVVDGTGPSAGKMRAMVEAKNVTWDVCDSGSGTCLELGKQGFFDEFDYSIVDPKKVPAGFAYKWGIANYLFSYVLVYDKAKFGNNPPKKRKDFWDLKNFPGKRTMREGHPVAARDLADGRRGDRRSEEDLSDRREARVRQAEADQGPDDLLDLGRPESAASPRGRVLDGLPLEHARDGAAARHQRPRGLHVESGHPLPGRVGRAEGQSRGQGRLRFRPLHAGARSGRSRS